MTQEVPPIIRMPLARRLRIWQQRFVPAAVWILAVGAAVVLSQRQSRVIDGVGSSELRQVAVAPLMDGAIQGIAKDLYDTVNAGDVVAYMDDTLVSAELHVAEAELAQQRSLLASERQRIELEYADAVSGIQDDLRRFIIDEEAARLDYLDRLVLQETDKVRLQRLQVQLARYEGLVKQDLLDEAAYDQLRLECEAMQTKLRENALALESAAAARDEAVARREERGNALPAAPDMETFLAPIREALNVQEARIAEVENRRGMLFLKAPLSGQVTQLLHRPGETVLAGSPVLMLTDPNAQRVVAYVDERTGTLPQVGDSVEVRSRRKPQEVIMAKVIKIGAQVEEMPPHLWASPISAQRGIPLLLGDMPHGLLLAGESVNIRFRPGAR